MADNQGWHWSPYIVAIIDAGILVLLISIEETLFPRFLFSRTIGVLPTIEDQANKNLPDAKDPESKRPDDAVSVEVDLPVQRDLPRRTYIQQMKLFVYFPEDRTTYMQCFFPPFILFLFPNVVIAGCIFACSCTAGIVSFNTIPEILTEEPYNWPTTSAGLIFFAALIGNIVGWATDVLSDHIVLYLARRNGGIKEPETRLWTLCISFVYAAVGYQLYGWGAQFGDSWLTIAFGVGLMIAHQISACSVATAYAMECFPGIGGELVVVLAICSSCINFAFSYSVQPFIDATGYEYAFLFFGLCVLSSMLAAIPMVIYGKAWRR